MKHVFKRLRAYRSMNKELVELKKIIRFKNYGKMKKYVKMIKDKSLTSEERENFNMQVDLIKILIKNDINFLLCNDKPVDNTRIEISKVISDDYYNEVTEIIRKDVVEKYSNEFYNEVYFELKGEEYKCDEKINTLKIDINTIELTYISDLNKVYSTFTRIFDKLRVNTMNFRELNIEGDFVFKISTFIKQLIADFFYLDKINEKEYIEALYNTITFEDKYLKNYFIEHSCGDHQLNKTKKIVFSGEDVFINENNKETEDKLLEDLNENSKFAIVPFTGNINSDKIEDIQQKLPNDHEKNMDLDYFNQNALLNYNNLKEIDKMSLEIKGYNLKPKFSKKNFEVESIILDEQYKNYIQLSKKPLIFCVHMKMLSRSFLSHINFYIDSFFKNIKSSGEEMKILLSIIYSFKMISNCFNNIKYFEDKKLYDYFIEKTDKFIKNIIIEIKEPKNMEEALVILNSLIFTTDTFNDLLEKVYLLTSKEYLDLEYTEESKIKEKETIKFIENKIFTLFNSITPKTVDFSTKTIDFIRRDILIPNYSFLSEALLFFILELTFSYLFSSIYKCKLKESTAEKFLFQIIEIKHFLRNKIDVIPLLQIIENYLKIFLCAPSSTNDFIHNFFIHSKRKFSFSQILSRLENDDNNLKLFITYKKIQQCGIFNNE